MQEKVHVKLSVKVLKKHVLIVKKGHFAEACFKQGTSREHNHKIH